MGFRRFAYRFPIRFSGRVLCLLVILGQFQSAIAQQGVAISPSVVLVLKLVSSTLVKPTTGIVVSDDGMVLVPAEFAAEEGEMIVLDGGGDILSNGRPAKLVAGRGSGDLALLSVKGLKRPGISLAGNLSDNAGNLHLEAFPPAEYIAKGAQPLKVPVEALHDGENGQFSISSATSLPYVTGAIVDACGNLAGVSLTSGPQSLDSGQAAAVLFGAELVRVLTDMQVNLHLSNCARPIPEAVAPVAASGKINDTAKTSAPAEPVTENNPDSNMVSDSPETVDQQPLEAPLQDVVVSPVTREAATSAPESPSIWQTVPAWLALLVIIVLVVSIWKGILLFKLSNKPPKQSHAPGSTSAVQPASDEPVTAPLDTGSDDGALKPRSAPVLDFEVPATAARPEGCNGLLLVEGMFDTDIAFKRFCFVNTAVIDSVIGRGDADIAIEHPAISRSHARIRTEGEHLTFSDLGSRNGSFIGDVPCLPGEIMFIDVDDEIFLGDVKITLRVVTQEAQWA